MNRKNFLTLVLIFFASISFAQNNSNDVRPAQLTVNYPLGTNGISSYKYDNGLSVNLFVGLNGGVKGAEFGGLGNINLSDVYGAQFGGLFNVVKGDVSGAQFGGLSNIVVGDAAGFQGSGLLNVNTGSFNGIQVGGLVNANKGNMSNLQIGGLANANYGNAKGLQIAGLVNTNFNKPDTVDTKLVQISGVLNQNASAMTGTQITGILNVASDSICGAQIGLINIANKMKGTQIGLVNLVVSDSSEVVPIGLINFVNGGLFELELSTTEYFHTNLSYKMGVERFYTILKVGLSFAGNKAVYSYGAGLGRYFNINDKNKVSLDVSCNNLSEYFLMSSSLDLLNKLDISYKHYFTDNIGAFIGPSFNVYLSKDFGYGEQPLINPLYTFSAQKYNNIYLYNWVGVNAGISFKF